MQKQWIEMIVHMIGCGKHIHERSRGYRNYYCASYLPDDEEYVRLIEMERLGYVKSGNFINDGRNQYFHATKEGCRAARIEEKYIERVFKS